MNAPLAHPLVADDFSVEWEFSEMEYEADGMSIDGGVSGTAVLALNNPGDRDFYVQRILINAHQKERFVRSSGFLDSRRIETVLRLDPAELLHEPTTFKALLFFALRDAIEADEGAAEWFRQQLGDE